MKIKNIFLFAALSFFALPSCNKEEGEKKVQDAIAISEECVNFNFESGENATISIETQSDWTIEGLDDGVTKWLSLDKTSGTGDAVVTLNCIEFNPWNVKRKAVLVFKSGEASANLLVCQLPDPDRSVCLDKETVQLGPAAGESAEINVITNKGWQLEGAEEYSEWLSVSPDSGTEGGKVTLRTLDINEEIEPREARLGFRIDRVNCAQLSVIQPCGIVLSLDKDEFVFDCNGNQTLSLNITCNAKTKEWTIDGIDDDTGKWVTFDKTSGTGNARVNIRTIARNDDLVKTETFVVRVDDVHYQAFTVTQNSSLEIHLNPSTLTFNPEGSQTLQTVVTTTTAAHQWYVEGYTDDVKKWLSLDTEKFTGKEKTISLKTLSENRTSADRTAVLTFHLTETICEELKVIQKVVPLETYTIYWKGVSGYDTVLAPEGETGYKFFPYASAQFSKTNKVYDGRGGAVLYEGACTLPERPYVFNNVDGSGKVISSATLYWGAMTPPNTWTYPEYFFFNNARMNIRMTWCYVKIPAVEGFKLTHVLVASDNADQYKKAKSASLCKDIAATQPLHSGDLELLKLDFYKSKLFDYDLTDTEPNVPYYFSLVADGQFNEFRFVYSEVR